MGDMIGLEEGLVWLPSHVLEEALFDHPNTDKLPQPIRKHQNRFHHGTFSRPTPSPAENVLPSNRRQKGWQKHNQSRYNNRGQKNGGGERMQAFFIASGSATSGTGVFLPTTTASPRPNKKPPCAPVLLPSRVVRALNLDVHSLALQVTPRPPDGENDWRKKNRVHGSTRNSGDVNLITTSPEMFLPEEWTY